VAPYWSVLISSRRKVANCTQSSVWLAVRRQVLATAPMLSQPKSAMHQQPAKLSWQVISGSPPMFNVPVAFFASYWSAGFERFHQPPALVSHWLGGFAGGEPTL
jgi:hypothetical protein